MSTVPLDGIVKRASAKLEILRGFYLNEPVKLSSQRPLHTGEQPLSGQLIILDKAELGGKGAYKLATQGLLNSNNGFCHITKADWNDRDVLASGVVNGLSLTDDFEFQTAFYDAGTYALHDELTVGSTPGSFGLAASGQRVIARVSRVGDNPDGTTNMKGQISGVEDAGLNLLTVETVSPYTKA